jgi:hypothetical protein
VECTVEPPVRAVDTTIHHGFVIKISFATNSKIMIIIINYVLIIDWDCG